MTDNGAVSSSSATNPDRGGYYQGTYQYFEHHSSPVNVGECESNGMVGSSPSSDITSPAKSYDSFSPSSCFVSPPPSQLTPSQFQQHSRVFNFDGDVPNGPRGYQPLNPGSYGNGYSSHCQAPHALQSHPYPQPYPGTFSNKLGGGSVISGSAGKSFGYDASKLPFHQFSSKNTQISSQLSNCSQYFLNQESHVMQPECSNAKYFDNNSTKISFDTYH